MFVEIIPARRLPRQLEKLTYISPPGLKSELKIGQMTSVPLNNTSQIGIIRSFSESPPSKIIKKIKPFTNLLNPEPALSLEQILFLEEIASLYKTSLGFLVRNSLFPFQKKMMNDFWKCEKNNFKLVEKKNKTNVYSHQNDKQLIDHVTKIISQQGQHLLVYSDFQSIEEKKLNFFEHNPYKTHVVTSQTSNAVMFEIWKKIWRGEPVTILGTRRAFFLPWSNLCNIMVVDEADPLHKNWDMNPRIHNRDAAKLLTKHHGATLHLCGHTPSLESYYGSSQIHEEVSIPRLPPPHTTLVNLKDEKKSGFFGILSEEAKVLIEKSIDNNESIFLFSNHRGSSSYVTCDSCDKLYSCNKCLTPLVFHLRKKIIQCHICKTSYPFPTKCEVCGSFGTKLFQNGTEALENELIKISHNRCSLVRIDSDSEERNFFFANPVIIIGTQRAWKKIPWKQIKLFIYVDPDTVLQLSEYKSNEIMWYTLRDSFYRLPQNTTYIIQTMIPQHPVFSAILQPNFFYKEEIKNRKISSYAPFSYLVKFYIGLSTKEDAETKAQSAFTSLTILTKKLKSTIIISSPRSSAPEFFKKKYWQVIIVKMQPRLITDDLIVLVNSLSTEWKIDLNPQSLLGF
jgi:primosomal protein N' (replication factor Y)